MMKRARKDRFCVLVGVLELCADCHDYNVLGGCIAGGLDGRR
jgi:hypothetical protein